MSIKITGLDDLQKQLEKMKKGAQELSGTNQVPFDELFTSVFMRKCSSFDSLDQLLEAGGFHVETQEDFEAIPDEQLDKHIAASTKFNTWEEMLGEATTQYIGKKLGF